MGWKTPVQVIISHLDYYNILLICLPDSTHFPLRPILFIALTVSFENIKLHSLKPFTVSPLNLNKIQTPFHGLQGTIWCSIFLFFHSQFPPTSPSLIMFQSGWIFLYINLISFSGTWKYTDIDMYFFKKLYLDDFSPKYLHGCLFLVFQVSMPSLQESFFHSPWPNLSPSHSPSK